jgi:hypothetical protein
MQFLIINKTGGNPVRVANSIFFQSFQRYRLLITVKGLVHTSVVFRLTKRTTKSYYQRNPSDIFDSSRHRPTTKNQRHQKNHREKPSKTRRNKKPLEGTGKQGKNLFSFFYYLP